MLFGYLLHEMKFKKNFQNDFNVTNSWPIFCIIIIVLYRGRSLEFIETTQTRNDTNIRDDQLTIRHSFWKLLIFFRLFFCVVNLKNKPLKMLRQRGYSSLLFRVEPPSTFDFKMSTNIINSKNYQNYFNFRIFNFRQLVDVIFNFWVYWVCRFVTRGSVLDQHFCGSNIVLLIFVVENICCHLVINRWWPYPQK